MSCWAIVAAAGSGTRMGGDTVKTLQILDGREVICHSVERLGRVSDGIVLCAREEDIPAYREAMERAGLRVDRYVLGGLTPPRQRAQCPQRAAGRLRRGAGA